MTDTQSTDTAVEVLQAIANAVACNESTLVEPSLIRRMYPGNAQMSGAELTLADGKLAGITGWAKAMELVDRITIIGGHNDQIYLQLTGLLPGAAMITVVSWVDDMPLNVVGYGEITLPELLALADGTGQVRGDAVVVAR